MTLEPAIMPAGWGRYGTVPDWSITQGLYMDKIKVGDRVEAPTHGKGTVLAIVNDNAWVQTEVRDYPLTFDIKKLKLVPKPRKGVLCIVSNEPDWWGSSPTKVGTVHWDVQAIELTADVRERVKDLL